MEGHNPADTVDRLLYGECKRHPDHLIGWSTAKSSSVNAAGKFCYPGGDVYEGEYLGNVKHGFGLYFYAAGDAYAGFWRDDLRHGWGLFIKKTGLRYEGCWALDVREGWGAQSLADGTRFMGSFKANARHGTGVVFSPGGLVYCGEWDLGQPLTKELLFAEFPLQACPLNIDADSDSSSSSEDLARTGFGARLKQIQEASNVMSVGRWTAAMAAYFVEKLGLPDAALCFAHVRGDQLLSLLQGHPDSILRELGVRGRYGRRGVHLAVLQLMKQRRRALYLQRPHSSGSIPSSCLLTTDVIQLGSRIGEGSFGRVYQGVFSANGAGRRSKLDVNVAIKVFRVSNSNTLWYDESKERDKADGDVQHARNFYQEFRILSRLKHPHIVMFLGVLVSPLYCIVTEYVPCGSLYDLLHKQSYPFSLSQMLKIALNVACALAHMHSQGVVHCDVKSPNVLVESSGQVKLCDFGLAIDFNDDMEEFRACRAIPAGSVGTHPWMAPELLRGESVTKAADVYSFGVLLWEMITRQIPFDGWPLGHVIASVGYGGMRPRLFTSAEESPPVAPNSGSSKESSSGETWTANELWHPLTRYLGVALADVRSELCGQPDCLINVLAACLAFVPQERPTFDSVVAAVNCLSQSAIVEVEETLRSFFGQD
ncbi:MAG: uncharacterized protein KVP18_004408 [Porospora cf. gigantea A]|uniref:uncharacterized protein n=1 Tax=Porospora cf. gigantea A TaxID=2853593 RepID=UPI0035595BED|nr:MAG: hypothetical protein KVP18_004408 [Porospora cf. gigantea A]